MKKVLFALSLFAAFTFAACDDTSDCVCNIKDSNGTILVNHSEATNGSLDIKDFDGDCKDAAWSDLPDTTWTSMEATGVKLVCEEK